MKLKKKIIFNITKFIYLKLFKSLISPFTSVQHLVLEYPFLFLGNILLIKSEFFFIIGITITKNVTYTVWIKRKTNRTFEIRMKG